MPNFSSSACLKKVVPLPLRLAYTFSCSGSFTPLQLTNQTKGRWRRFAMSVTLKIFSDWPAIQAPAMTLLSKPMMTAHFPLILPRPSTTPVVPDSSSIGSKRVCKGHQVPGSNKYSSLWYTVISPLLLISSPESPAFFTFSTAPAIIFSTSLICFTFSSSFLIFFSVKDLPKSVIFSKYGFMNHPSSLGFNEFFHNIFTRKKILWQDIFSGLLFLLFLISYNL